LRKPKLNPHPIKEARLAKGEKIRDLAKIYAVSAAEFRDYHEAPLSWR
jgi:hypothetical protein